MPRLFVRRLHFGQTLHSPVQAAKTDQPDQHSHDQQPDNDLHRSRHYRVAPCICLARRRNARAIASASGAADAVNESGVGVDTLEISTATAGAVMDRNARTGTPVAAEGEPEKAWASSP